MASIYNLLFPVVSPMPRLDKRRRWGSDTVHEESVLSLALRSSPFPVLIYGKRRYVEIVALQSAGHLLLSLLTLPNRLRWGPVDDLTPDISGPSMQWPVHRSIRDLTEIFH